VTLIGKNPGTPAKTNVRECLREWGAVIHPDTTNEQASRWIIPEFVIGSLNANPINAGKGIARRIPVRRRRYRRMDMKRYTRVAILNLLRAGLVENSDENGKDGDQANTAETPTERYGKDKREWQRG
jgi:hypothetical protein